MRRSVGLVLLVASAVPTLAGSPAEASVPATGSVQSNTGFLGCTTPGSNPGRPTVEHCFVALPSPGGSLQVEGWTYVHTIPGTVASDETITAPSSALQVNPDGSFTFNVSFPQMGVVSLSGAGGLHVYESDKEGPLTYAVASTSASIGPYDPVGGSFPASATVAGQRQTELRGAVWWGPASGHWDFVPST